MASTLACIDLCCHARSSHHITAALHVTEESWQCCAVQWLVLKHMPQQRPPVLSWKNVTGTFFKKYYLIPNQAPFRPNADGPRVTVLYHICGQKKVNGYKLIQFYILKGDGCLCDRRRLLTQNLNTLKCTIKHFINRETQHKLLDCIMINL